VVASRRGRCSADLPLDLTGDEKGMAGKIVPEFFNKAGERVEIPPEFVGVLKAAVRGANCVGCAHQHYLTAPKAAAAAAAKAETTGVATVPTEEPAPSEHAVAV
jgi:hypothetical protein